MTNQTTDEQNRIGIQEFLDRAPRINMSMVVKFNATDEEDSVEFGEPVVVEDETDVAISEALADESESRVSFGIATTGDIPPDLQSGFNEFYDVAFGHLRGERMTEETLIQPARLMSVFLEGVKAVGRITDYDVRFDPSRSSHRFAALSYSVAITATSSVWWNDKAKWLWDTFTDFILHRNAPDIIARIVDALPGWIEMLNEILPGVTGL